MRIPLNVALLSTIFVIVFAEIPVVPRCPLDLVSLLPCQCGTPLVRGLRIVCHNVNLPILAKRFQLLTGDQIAVLEVDGGSLRRWDRNLFADVPILEVTLRNVSMQTVEKTVMREHLELVSKFALPFNELESVPEIILSMISLRYLDLSFNKIRTFPMLSGLPLEELNIAGNSLQEIAPNAFAAMPSLVSLSPAYNNFQTIPRLGFLRNHGLQVLNMSGNIISSIGPNELRNLSYLQTLDLSHNKISNLDETAIRGLSRLLALYLDHNDLKELPTGIFDMSRTLTNLSLSFNHLATFGPELLANLFYIQEILLDNNMFRDVPSNFIADKSYLKTLDLSWNPIATIREHALDGLKNITTINLSNCLLATIETMGIGELMGLTTLLLNNNNLESIQGDSLGFLPSVQNLDLSNNLITSLKNINIAKMIGVMSLKLSGNNIVVVKSNDMPKLPMLMHLDLSWNGLRELSTGSLKDYLSLMTLKLNDNALQAIGSGTFGSMYSLLEVDISKSLTSLAKVVDQSTQYCLLNHLGNNNITSFQRFALRGLRSVRTVKMDNNFIPELFQLPTTLDYISARNNSIPEIRKASFPRANSLTYLDLSFNNISYLEPGSFQYLIILNTLLLRGNRLTAIPKADLQNRVTLQSLDLGENDISTVDWDAFSGLRLRNLSLDHNNISALNESTFKGFAEMLELRIDGNHLPDLDPALFKGLQSALYVDVGYNMFTELNSDVFNDLYSVKRLGLAGNKLDTFPRRLFEQNKYLEDVDFSHNQFRTVPSYLDETPAQFRSLNFSGNFLQEILGIPNLPALENLDLSRNTFQHLFLNSITKMPKLKDFRINDNPLEVLSDGVLDCDLEYLNLDRTLLHTVPFSLIMALNRNTSKLSFEEMSILCDCRIVGLQEFLRWKDPSNKNTCAAPPSLAGVPILNATFGSECDRSKQAAVRLLREQPVLHLSAVRSGYSIKLSWEPKAPLDMYTFTVSLVYENKSINLPQAHIPYFVSNYNVEDLSFSNSYRACVQTFATDGHEVGTASCKLVRLADLEISNGGVLIRGYAASCFVALSIFCLAIIIILR